MIAERVQAIKGGPNSEAARFLRSVSLADMQSKETWPKLRGVALVKPRGDILPVRTVFEDDRQSDAIGGGGVAERGQQIGLNIIESGPPTWYSFADIISSKLLTGKCPEMMKTIELVPHGVQKGLKPIAFFGDPEFTIDLYKDDLFTRVIDMRTTIDKNDPKNLALKLLASATSFGATIEFIVDEHKDPTGTTVYYSDKDARRIARAAVPSGDGGHEISGYKVERAGKWFSPWGPLIPAGGRLLLAIAERLAADRGLDYVFTDTDAMTFARPRRYEPRGILRASARDFRAERMVPATQSLFERRIFQYRRHEFFARKQKGIRAALCAGGFCETLCAGEPWIEWGMDHPQSERTWARTYHRASL